MNIRYEQRKLKPYTWWTMPQIYAHDGGTQSLYIIYALPRVFREATGKQRFRETFRGASATAVPASAKVLELTSLTKLFLGGFDRCSRTVDIPPPE